MAAKSKRPTATMAAARAVAARATAPGAAQRGAGLHRGDSLLPNTPRRRAIAVTGANTFLGRSLVALLEEDPAIGRVVVLDLKNTPAAGGKTVFYEIDLTHSGVESKIAEILHAEGVKSVVHLAFLASPTQATAWAHELESVGTMHLLAACQKCPIDKLVVSSSVLAYGPHPANPNFLGEDAATRGLHGSEFVADKLDVEGQLERFAAKDPRCAVIVLRFAPILGPTIDNYVARWLSRPFVPIVMGSDPLVQLVHEVDAVAALRIAIDAEARGVFNVVGEGVLPISSVVKLAGRAPLPIPYAAYRGLSALLWVAQLSEAPPGIPIGAALLVCCRRAACTRAARVPRGVLDAGCRARLRRVAARARRA